MRDPVLETERLVLRPMVAADLEELCAIFGDPAVMASFAAEPLDREQTGRWLTRNLDHQREHGYGLFAVCLKGGGRLIGDCGLEHMDLAGERVAELGYDFRSDHWNRGYATEAARAVRDFAFGTLGLPRLVSLIRPGNPASERVAQKTGLERTGQIEHDGRTYLRYEIDGPSSLRVVETADPVVVKVVSGQSEAEVVCGLLRSAGIKCAYRDTDAIDSSLEDFMASGAQEILVHESDLEAARQLIADAQG